MTTIYKRVGQEEGEHSHNPSEGSTLHQQFSRRFQLAFMAVLVVACFWLYSGGDQILVNDNQSKYENKYYDTKVIAKQKIVSNAESGSELKQNFSPSIPLLSQQPQPSTQNKKTEPRNPNPQPEPTIEPIAIDVQTSLQTQPQQQVSTEMRRTERVGSPAQRGPVKHRFLMIRHGQSGYNLGGAYFAQQNIRPTDVGVDLRFSMDMLDVGITNLGIKQAKLAKSILAPRIPSIALVIVSPLRRALQTCDIIFGQTGVKVIVEPLMNEMMAASCDIPGALQQSISKYGQKFDFSRVPSPPQSCFMTLFQPSLQQSIAALNKKHNFQSLIKSTIEYLKTSPLEDDRQRRQRTTKLKQVLQGYAREVEGKGDLVLVAHGGLFGQLVASQDDFDGDQLIRERQFQNGKPEDIEIVF